MALHKNTLRVMSALMCASFTCSNLAATAYAEVTGTVQFDTVYGKELSKTLPDSSTLFDAYICKIFDIAKDPRREVGKLPAVSQRKPLDEVSQILYDSLIDELVKVANGTVTETVFRCPIKEIEDNAGREVDFSEIDLGSIVDALLSDIPYELYWYDKTSGVSVSYESPSIFDRFSGQSLGSLVFSFPVSADYSTTGQTGTTQTDTAKTSAALKASENAKDIIAGVDPHWTDYKVLEYFKEGICDLVSYNDYAASNAASMDYGDPWQMVYVFDKDDSTNVVCEGYSKAFKYLCDMYDFNSDVTCSIVTGNMQTPSSSGGHMWNVVSLNGRNYFVDVTNSDKGSIGEDGELFFVGVPAEDRLYDDEKNYIGVSLSADRSNMYYVYDYSTTDLFYESELLIEEQSPMLHTVIWMDDADNTLETDEFFADGETPAYNGETPTSENGVFAGWDPDVPAGTGITSEDETIVFVAQFVKACSASFYVRDEQYYSTDVKEGDTVAEPEDPAIDGCIFDGWYTDKEFTEPFEPGTPVVSDISLYAKFLCRITWVNDDGEELWSDDVVYGEVPVYGGSVPIKPDTEENTFVFTGWSPEISAAESEAVYTAQFETVEKPLADESETDAYPEPVSDVEPVSDTDSDTISDTEPVTDTEQGSDTDPASDTEPVTDTDSENETDNEPGSDVEPGSDTDSGSDVDPTSDIEPVSDTDTRPSPKPTPDPESDPEPVKTGRPLGDVNNDGTVDSLDALMLLRNSIGLETLPEEDSRFCDADGNGILDSADALLILRYTVAFDDGIGIGEMIY